MEIFLSLAISYFLGSIPTAYIAGKKLKGIDITSVGSRTAGGANIWQTVSKKASVIVSLTDLAKGALVVIMAKLWSFALPVQISCGLIAIIGHNWSPFIRFKGGRGMACAGGILLVLAPLQILVIAPVIILGFILKNLSLAAIISAVSLPLFSWGMIQNSSLTLGLAGIPLLMIIKRITANWEPFTPGKSGLSVIFYRLLLDRDIPDREAWIKRGIVKGPDQETPG